MKPLVKSHFCQGLKELVTEEDFEGVLPVFEFQKKRIAQDPQRTITALGGPGVPEALPGGGTHCG